MALSILCKLILKTIRINENNNNYVARIKKRLFLIIWRIIRCFIFSVSRSFSYLKECAHKASASNYLGQVSVPTLIKV